MLVPLESSLAVLAMIRSKQGRSDGGGVYRDIYPPSNRSTLNFLCGCFVSLTQDKFDIVQFIPTQIKFLATPLAASMCLSATVFTLDEPIVVK